MTRPEEMTGPELGRYIGRVNDATDIETLREIVKEAEARFPHDEATPRIHRIAQIRIERLAHRN